MDYEEIMRTITSGLTGNPESDVEYLEEQSEIYKTHELGTEILRGIGRIMYEVLPDEMQEKFSFLVNNILLSTETVLEEAEFQIHKKNFNKALKIIQSLLKEIEDDNGDIIMFRDDSVNEYHHFRNLLEEILYQEIKNPQRTLRQIPENYDHLYHVYGSLLFELKRFDESKKALEKAIAINPMNLEAIFELAEISKLNGSWEEYLEITKQCLPIAYTGKSLGRCYRNLGFYYTEKQNFDVATALYYVSMYYDRQSTMAQAELYYIQNITGKPIQQFSLEEIKEIFDNNNIHFGPNELILSIAFGFGETAMEEKHYEMAHFFFSIVYGLTFDDEIKKLIEKLSIEAEIKKFAEKL